MVMERSLNMKNWQNVMEFCDYSLNFKNFSPKFYVVPLLLNLSLVQKVYIFRPFPQNVSNTKFEQRDGQGKSRKTDMEKSWKQKLSLLEPWLGTS